MVRPKAWYLGLALALLWPATPAMARQAVEPRLRSFVMDDMEDPQWGNLWSTLAYAKADPELHRVEQPVRTGRAAGRVSVEPGGFVRLILRAPGLPATRDADHPNWTYYDARPPHPLPGEPQAVGLWVYGRGGGQRISVQVADRSGQDPWRRFELGTVDFDGWQLMTADLTAGENPLKRQYPWFLGAFEITGGLPGAPTELVIDDLTVWTFTDEPFLLRGERFSGGLADRACVEGEPFEVRVRADNLTDERLSLPVEYAVYPNNLPAGREAPALARGQVELALEAGAHGEARFPLTLPAGVYRIELCATAAGQRRRHALEGVPVFPAAGPDASVPPPTDVEAMLAELRTRDLFWITGSLHPGALLWSRRPALGLFGGLEAWGLGGPGYVAVPTAAGVRIVPAGEEIAAADMSEPWLLVWYHGSQGWTNLTAKSLDDWRGRENMHMDSPWLLVLQNKPAELRLPDKHGGLGIRFDGEAGYAVLLPLYGARVVQAETTASWRQGLPEELVRRCRDLAAASHHFPIETTESFAIDFAADKVHVRERLRYVSFEDQWGSPARKFAPVPPLMGLALRAGCPFLSFEPAEPVDLNVPLSVGPWYGVPEADEYTWTLSGLLGYVTSIDTPLQARLENPHVRQAYEQILANMRGGTNLDWYISGNMRNWLPDSAATLGFLREPLRSELARHLRWASLQTVVPNNLNFHWDGRAIRGNDALAGHDVGYFNPSNYGVFAAYALHSRDVETIRSRWHYHSSLLTNFAGAPWDSLGWPGGLAGGGFFDFVSSAMYHARLSRLAGNAQGYRYGIFLATRALLAHYAVGMGANDYVRSLCPWPMMDMRIKQDPQTGRFYNGPGKKLDHGMMSDENWVLPVADWEDFSFTDSWGGNLGLGPWANLVRPQEAFHEGIGRFWRDHMGRYMRYWLDQRYRKFMPQWYDAVVRRKVEPEPGCIDLRTGQPVWFERNEGDGMEEPGVNRHMNLRLRRLVFGEDVDQIHAMHQAMRSSRAGSVRAVLEAGTDWELQTLDPMPYLVDGQPGYELGNQREGGSGGTLRTCWTQVMTDRSWPILAYYGYLPPTMPAGLGATHLGVLPATGYVRTAPADSVVEVEHAMLTWNAEVRAYRTEQMTAQDVLRASELRRRLPALAEFVPEAFKGSVEAVVEAYESGATAAWMVVGPFHTGTKGGGFEVDYGPEAGVDYEATYPDGSGRDNKTVRWRPMRMSDAAVDLAAGLGGGRNRVAYAATRVYVPHDMQVYVLTGSDDGIKLWINDRCVLAKRVWRGLRADQDATKVTLRQGWNRLLVKVDQGEGGWGLALRIADARYKLPIPELRIDPNGR